MVAAEYTASLATGKSKSCTQVAAILKDFVGLTEPVFCIVDGPVIKALVAEYGAR